MKSEMEKLREMYLKDVAVLGGYRD